MTQSIYEKKTRQSKLCALSKAKGSAKVLHCILSGTRMKIFLDIQSKDISLKTTDFCGTSGKVRISFHPLWTMNLYKTSWQSMQKLLRDFMLTKKQTLPQICSHCNIWHLLILIDVIDVKTAIRWSYLFGVTINVIIIVFTLFYCFYSNCCINVNMIQQSEMCTTLKSRIPAVDVNHVKITSLQQKL